MARKWLAGLALPALVLASTAAGALAHQYMLVATETPPGNNPPPSEWGGVLRFGFTGTGQLCAWPPIPSDVFSDPAAVAFDSRGELFVANRQGYGNPGAITHLKYLALQGFTVQETIVGNELSSVHQLSFAPDGELFAPNWSSGTVSRFRFDPNGQAIPNGSFATGVFYLEGIAITPSYEMFVTHRSHDVLCFQIDVGTGQVIANGSFLIPGAADLHYLALSPTGELFAADPSRGKVFRCLFDPNGTPIANGSIDAPIALGVAFSPDGELFVAKHYTGAIYRFTFGPSGEAIPNGMLPLSASLGGVAVLDMSVLGLFLGDLNCDGIVDFGDINPFVLAIADPAAYGAAYPNCNYLNGDCNADGYVDFDDINPFIAILSGG